MKKIVAGLLAGLLAMATTAQKTIIDPNAEKRSVSGYHGIEVSGGIDLVLSYGDESVAVSASETKYRDNIKTEVENGILKIYYGQKNGIHIDWDNNRKMKAYVSYKTLDKLSGSGGSDISVDGSIKSNSLELKVSGGSDFNGKVEVTDLNVISSGGSDVDISGTARKADVRVSGGSDFKGYELATDICEVNASGGSDFYITVNKELSANASGGSDIHYKGSGTVKEMSSSGSSSIKKSR